MTQFEKTTGQSSQIEGKELDYKAKQDADEFLKIYRELSEEKQKILANLVRELYAQNGGDTNGKSG